jgi:hypothetical protein
VVLPFCTILRPDNLSFQSVKCGKPILIFFFFNKDVLFDQSCSKVVYENDFRFYVVGCLLRSVVLQKASKLRATIKLNF